MKKEIKVSDLAYELAKFPNQLGLLENYFSCISLQNIQGQRDHAIVSLFEEKGLDNSMEMITAIGEQIQKIADLLCNCDVTVQEVTTNEE